MVVTDAMTIQSSVLGLSIVTLDVGDLQTVPLVLVTSLRAPAANCAAVSS